MNKPLALVAASLLMCTPRAILSAPKPLSTSDYDGLYYWTTSSTSPDDMLEYCVVLSHNGKAVPPKENEPDAPTQPGLYRRNVRYSFDQVAVSGKHLAFRTASVSEISYSFEGTLGSENDPQFDRPIPLFSGTLSEFHNGKLHLERRITFSHAVIY